MVALKTNTYFLSISHRSLISCVQLRRPHMCCGHMVTFESLDFMLISSLLLNLEDSELQWP